MSKAVLVIDMPESCDMCDFVDKCQPPIYGVEKMYCGFPGIGEDVSDCIACRHESCPLRELPEKITEPIDADDVGKDYSQGTMDGWNACINAITGE